MNFAYFRVGEESETELKQNKETSWLSYVKKAMVDTSQAPGAERCQS